MSQLSCDICVKSFANKYTLATHLKYVHQKTPDNDKRVDLQQYKCASSRCSHVTAYRSEHKRHLEKCVYVSTDVALAQLSDQHKEELQKALAQLSDQHKEELQKWKDQYREELMEKDLEIRGLMSKLEVMEQMMASRVKHADDLANRMADRSTTTNNTYNHIQHVLVDGKTFLALTNPDRIEAITRENTDKYFWQGQSGAANLVYNHIVCVDDNDQDDQDDQDKNEKRMLMVCTDVSRKKCKYNNDKNELAEDIGAAHFLSKVAEPITEVAKEWHTTVTKKLEHEKRSKIIDSGTADKKTEQADMALFDLLAIKDDNRNQRFVNKLCTLTKV